MTTPVPAPTTPPRPGRSPRPRPAAARSTSAWGAATDNLAITGYQIERCQGAGCSNFTQIATPTGTSYNDTGLTAEHQLQLPRPRHRRGRELGPYSNTATAFTGLTISPRVTDLTFTRTQQFTAQGAHAASPGRSTACMAVSAGTGTITSAGLYTPPSTAGTHTVTAATPISLSRRAPPSTSRNYAGTFTYHNDNCATGENLNETALTPSNVNSDELRQAVQLPARRPDARVTPLRGERHHPGQGRPQRRLRRDRARQRLRLRRRRAEQHAALAGLLHQPGRRRHAGASGGHR